MVSASLSGSSPSLSLNFQSSTGGRSVTAGGNGIPGTTSSLVKRTLVVALSAFGVARGVDFVGMGEREIDGVVNAFPYYLKAIILDGGSDLGVVAWITFTPQRVVARLFSGRDPLGSNVYLTPGTSEEFDEITLCPYRPAGSPPGFVLLRSVNYNASAEYNSIIAQHYVVNSTITPLGNAVELTNVSNAAAGLACVEFPKGSGDLHAFIYILTNPGVTNVMSAFDQNLVSIGNQLILDGAASDLGIVSNSLFPSITFATTETTPEKLLIVASKDDYPVGKRTNGKLVDGNFTTKSLISPILLPGGHFPSVAMNDEVAVVTALQNYGNHSLRLINVTAGVPIGSQTGLPFRLGKSLVSTTSFGFVNWLALYNDTESTYAIHANLFNHQGRSQNSTQLVSCSTSVTDYEEMATLPFPNTTILFYFSNYGGSITFNEFNIFDPLNPQINFYPNCDGSYPPEPTREPTPEPTSEPSPVPTLASSMSSTVTDISVLPSPAPFTLTDTSLVPTPAPFTVTNTGLNLNNIPREVDALVVATLIGMIAFSLSSLMMLVVLLKKLEKKKEKNQGPEDNSLVSLAGEGMEASSVIELTALEEGTNLSRNRDHKEQSARGGSSSNPGFIPAQARSVYHVFPSHLGDGTSSFTEPPAGREKERQKGEPTSYFDAPPVRLRVGTEPYEDAASALNRGGVGDYFDTPPSLANVKSKTYDEADSALKTGRENYDDATSALNRERAPYEDATSALKPGQRGEYFDEAPLRVEGEAEGSFREGDEV